MLSLIFEYNGLGRVDGQAGGPGGIGGGSMFGGTRRAAAAAQLGARRPGRAGCSASRSSAGSRSSSSTRLRRSDARTGWLLAVGGAFLTTAVLFSAASGIFHPYYVSLLAPFAAALVGAGVAHARGFRARGSRPLAIAAGVARARGAALPGSSLALPVLIACRHRCGRLPPTPARRSRLLRAAGAADRAHVWAVDTLGHATGTFPAAAPGGSRARRPGGLGSAIPTRSFGRPGWRSSVGDQRRALRRARPRPAQGASGADGRSWLVRRGWRRTCGRWLRRRWTWGRRRRRLDQRRRSPT